jgi:hypothetical protein
VQISPGEIAISPGHRAILSKLRSPEKPRIDRSVSLQQEEILVRKALPDTMFSDAERSRLSMLRSWVLDHKVTEIEMNEKQFWNFAQLQPVAEKPWTTFMGRIIRVADMPVDAQKQLGIFDNRNPGAI